jgi:IclR family transcriptional regulator, pca regulon regulatory protein
MKRASRKSRPSQDRDPLFNQSVEKAFAILEAFGAERRAMNLTEVSAARR